MSILALLPLRRRHAASISAQNKAFRPFALRKNHPPLGSLQILVVSIARQIFDCQRSDFFGTAIRRRRKSTSGRMITFDFFGYFHFSPPLLQESRLRKTMVGLDRLELSTSPLSGVR